VEQEKLIWEVDDLIAEETLQIPEGILADHMLLPGTVGILAGPNGAGKTWIGLKLADCISSGRLFGSLPTKERRVLFISEEMTPAEMRSRLLIFSKPQQHRGWRFRFQQGLKLNWNDGLMRFASVLRQEWEPELVIIDALRDVHTGPEASNDYMAEVMKGVRDKIARPFNCCVLFIHHYSKPTDNNGGVNSVRGAKVITDVASDVMLVDRDNLSRSISFPKVRHGAEPETMSFIIGETGAGKIDILFQ
jgi:RecA-family ATPase